MYKICILLLVLQACGGNVSHECLQLGNPHGLAEGCQARAWVIDENLPAPSCIEVKGQSLLVERMDNAPLYTGTCSLWSYPQSIVVEVKP
jgi:hypothetical protein